MEFNGQEMEAVCKLLRREELEGYSFFKKQDLVKRCHQADLAELIEVTNHTSTPRGEREFMLGMLTEKGTDWLEECNKQIDIAG